MEKVRTFRPASFRIRATTIDESTPPERKAPSGTSLCNRSSTADVTSSRNSSTFRRAGCLDLEIGPPVRRTVQPAVAVDGQMAGRKLGDAVEMVCGWGTY